MQLALDVPRPSPLPSPRPSPRPATQPTTCTCERCERTRVREHLLGAIEQLLANPGTTSEARVARAALIAELVRYAVRGVFPRNETVPERKVPIFVDRIGTRCAVAHLLDHTGEHELVDDVARAVNGAFVAELARDVRLRSWLDDWHLTEAEAARIQPCYQCPGLDPVDVCACSIASYEALLIGIVVIPEGEDPYLVVEAAYGEATAVAGDVITGVVDALEYEAFDGTRVLAIQTPTGARLLFAFEFETDRVSTDSEELGCEPITRCPESAPLQAFIDVAEGASCEATFSALEGWGYQEGSGPCGSPSGSGAGPSSSMASTSQATTGVGGDEAVASSSAATTGAGGAGGTGDVGGASADGGSGDGCGCGVGPGALDPATQGLLWALTAGLVLARRRKASRERSC